MTQKRLQALGLPDKTTKSWPNDYMAKYWLGDEVSILLAFDAADRVEFGLAGSQKQGENHLEGLCTDECLFDRIRRLLHL
jgi:hypothetical protein